MATRKKTLAISADQAKQCADIGAILAKCAARAEAGTLPPQDARSLIGISNQHTLNLRAIFRGIELQLRIDSLNGANALQATLYPKGRAGSSKSKNALQ
jgi:hypothetical protein